MQLRQNLQIRPFVRNAKTSGQLRSRLNFLAGTHAIINHVSFVQGRVWCSLLYKFFCALFVLANKARHPQQWVASHSTLAFEARKLLSLTDFR